MPFHDRKKRTDGISNNYEYQGSGGTGRHAHINLLGVFAMNELVQRGFDVLLHDADIVWLRSPLAALAHLARRRDVLGTRGPVGACGTCGINTGFLYFVSSFHGKIFAQSLVNLSALKKYSDQALFNGLLRHHRFSQLAVRVLPDRLFPGEAPMGRYGCAGMSKNASAAVQMINHRVGGFKIRGFQKCKHWFLKGKGMKEANVWVERHLNASWFTGRGDLCVDAA